MNKKLLELLNKINEKKEEVRNLAEAGKLEEAGKAKEELKNMQTQFDLLKDLDDEGTERMQTLMNKGEATQVGGEKDSVKEFANAARRGFYVQNKMSEGTTADGGYTVPEDIRTRIETYRESRASLTDLVSVEKVDTNKGSRTFKKRSQQTGFQKVGEGGKIKGKNTPQFERLSYEIDKYGGYFPVTNELLEDSDQAITDVLVEWIGNESRVTRNNIILEVAGEKAKTDLSDLDDIKHELNITLGSAFKSTSSIITNDDGLQWLDTLKDQNGRDLLQPNPTEPAKLQLRAGATVIPVKVFPNVDMPSDVKTAKKRKIPMLIGDLKEGIKFFDRKILTIKASDIAAAGELNAFEEDLTLFRAIEREDCKLKDSEAFVYGVLTIDDDTVAGESAPAGSEG